MDENNELFSAEEMKRRFERLKAEGKVPPLADILKVIQKESTTFGQEDRQLLKSMGIEAEPFLKTNNMGTIQQLMQQAAESLRQLSSEEQEQTRKAIYERTTGKPYRPESKPAK